METYRWTDFVWPVTLIVAFLASAPFGRKAWCMVDFGATFTFGLGLIFVPQVILGFQVTGGNLDQAHLFLARHIGVLLVGSAVTWYICRNSNDARLFGGLFYSRIFSCTLLVFAEAYSAYHLWNRNGIHFNKNYLMFGCGGVVVWALGSLVQLLRYREIGGYSPRSTCLDAGLWFDHFCLLLLAVLFFSFPSQMLKVAIKKQKASIDGVHVCLFRSVAALTIGHALSSHAAVGFCDIADKKAHVTGRLITQILSFGVNMYAHFVTDLFTVYNVTPMLLCGFYITFLLTLYFRCNQKTKSSGKEFDADTAGDADNKEYYTSGHMDSDVGSEDSEVIEDEDGEENEMQGDENTEGKKTN